MYIVVGYHGLDDQCIAVWVANMVCVSFIESDVIHFLFELLGRSLVRRVRGHDRSFLCFLEIAVLGSSRFPGEVWLAEDSPYLTRRSCLTLVVARLGASIADINSEVPFSDEFLDLILEHDALLCGVADVLVIPVIFILIPL